MTSRSLSSGSPGQKHFVRVFIAEGGREHKEACMWIPPDSMYAALINLSHEYKYMLSPMSPSSESLNTGWSWRHRYLSEYLK